MGCDQNKTHCHKYAIPSVIGEKGISMKVWVVVFINLSDDEVNAWVYHEFDGLKVFSTKEAAEKYVASQKKRSARVLEYLIREEDVLN